MLTVIEIILTWLLTTNSICTSTPHVIPAQKPDLDFTREGKIKVKKKKKAERKKIEASQFPKPCFCFLCCVFFSTGLFFFKQRAVNVRGQREGGCETLSMVEERASATHSVCVCGILRFCVC